MNPLVGQNLGLSQQQMNQLSQSQGQLMNTFNTQMNQLGNLTPAERNARLQALRTEFHTQFGTAANGVLTPAQQQRFRQLQFQQPGFGVFAQPAIQQQLSLTPGQIAQFQTHQADFDRQLTQIRETQDPARRQMLWEQLRDARADALRRILNANQLQTWDQLTGKPFNFSMDMNSTAGSP